MTAEVEEWRQVAGSRDYFISSLGSVLTQHRGDPRLLTPRVGTTGYYHVTIHGRTVKVHRLVAETFLGPRPDGAVIRHLDGNPFNNEVSNLAWGTPSENMRDSVRHGTHRTARKTHCPAGHPYDEANTLREGSRRRCRTCRSKPRGARAKTREAVTR